MNLQLKVTAQVVPLWQAHRSVAHELHPDGLIFLPMCHIKFKPDLGDLAQILKVRRYLEDTLHPNHIFYRIVPLTFVGNDSFPKVVMDAIEARDRYNLENPRNVRSGIMTWMIFSFAPGSFITEKEMRRIWSDVVALVAPGLPTDGFWHQNLFTGASDFNPLLATVLSTPTLHPRRDRKRNELGRVWHCIVKTVAALNAARRDECLPPIPTPSRRKPSPLIVMLADAAERQSLPPTAANMPTLCVAALGPQGDWLLEPDALVFSRGKRRRRAKRIPLAVLERLIQAQLWSRQVSEDRHHGLDVGLPTPGDPCVTSLSKVHGCVTDIESAEDFPAQNERELEP